MLEIGKQIKRMREERQLTGKDLAQQIGLSQSQMSRLEAGQRRIDTEILARIAAALGVPPGAFFPHAGGESTPELSLKREKELEISHLHLELGKIIRSERRRRHLTVDDLARKTGHTRAFVVAVEEGRRNGIEDGFLRKVSKLLAIDPFVMLEQHDHIIRDLKTRVNCLDQALADARPAGANDDTVPNRPHGTPILVGDESVYPVEFDESGMPLAAVEGFLHLPDLVGRPTFALRVVGNDMQQDGQGFEEGNLVVFATDRQARTGEYAFVRFGESHTAFRQILHDDGGLIRLQPIRRENPPFIFELSALQSAWPLVAHIDLAQ